MTTRTLFAYFEDGTLEHRSEELLDLLRDFVAERTWRGAKPYVVSQPRERPAALREASAPDWDLGLHVPLSESGSAGRDDDVDAVVEFLQRLRRETGHSFVLGVFDWAGRYAEELCYLDRPDPDLTPLRALYQDAPEKE